MNHYNLTGEQIQQIKKWLALGKGRSIICIASLTEVPNNGSSTCKELCHKLFPETVSRYKKIGPTMKFCCPCNTYSKCYVVKKAKRILKEIEQGNRLEV